MKNAQQLANELQSFQNGERNRCMSEIDGLLEEIREFLEAVALFPSKPQEDPTIESQLNLDLTPPTTTRYRPVKDGMFDKNLDTGEIQERRDYERFDEHPDYDKW